MPDFFNSLVSYHVIICDVCGRRDETAAFTERKTNRFSVSRLHEDAARSGGWRLFVSRSRRWYCPDHEPTPGHKMFEVR